MSKQSSSPSTKPKAAFAAASFADLRAATGDAGGEPLQLRLADIDEDPEQPRRKIDREELQSLAESIRYRGVLQPIGVRPGAIDRYTSVFGARRFRAAKIAGKSHIPALIVHQSQRDYATQVIENQQRSNLSNGDLANAVNRLFADGHKVKEIEAVCNLKDWQVAAYRAVERFPPFLATRLDTSDMRALYDLFRQWGHTAAEIEAAMPDAETYITVTEARRIIARITGKPTGSIVIAKEQVAAKPNATVVAETPTAEEVTSATQADGEARRDSTCTVQEPEPTADRLARANVQSEQEERVAKPTRPREQHAKESNEQPVYADRESGVPTFIVASADGERGRLIVDRRAASEGWALVAYATAIEEVEAKHLRIVAIE